MGHFFGMYLPKFEKLKINIFVKPIIIIKTLYLENHSRFVIIIYDKEMGHSLLTPPINILIKKG